MNLFKKTDTKEEANEEHEELVELEQEFSKKLKEPCFIIQCQNTGCSLFNPVLKKCAVVSMAERSQVWNKAIAQPQK